MTVGMVGYPNVGKSSTINALNGAKRVAVSKTPGKTKHFQVYLFKFVLEGHYFFRVFIFAHDKTKNVCNCFSFFLCLCSRFGEIIFFYWLKIDFKQFFFSSPILSCFFFWPFFQTIVIPGTPLTLCDCPGLVFPSFMSTKNEMVCNGLLRIAELKEIYGKQVFLLYFYVSIIFEGFFFLLYLLCYLLSIYFSEKKKK